MTPAELIARGGRVSKRYAQVVLLMEDKQHQTFLTRLLRALGYPSNKLRALPLPAGQGSGEQYVREHYSDEVREVVRFLKSPSDSAYRPVVRRAIDAKAIEAVLREVKGAAGRLPPARPLSGPAPVHSILARHCAQLPGV